MFFVILIGLIFGFGGAFFFIALGAWLFGGKDPDYEDEVLDRLDRIESRLDDYDDY